MGQEASHGRGIRQYESRLLAQKRLTVPGGIAEFVHRVAATASEIRLATTRHAVFFNLIPPPKTNDVFYDGRLTWRGGAVSARSAIIPAEGEMRTATRTELSGTEESKYLALFLDPELMLRAARVEHFTGVTLTPYWGDNDPFSWQLADALRAECEAGAPHGRLYADAAVTMLSLHLLRHRSNLDQRRLQPPRGGLAPYQLKRVTDYIGDRLTDELSLGELADLVGLSAHHFCRVFKQSTGLPPHRWQIQQRVEKAKALMLGTDLSLAEIAGAAGFSDQSHFTTVFRKAVGATPNAWRRATRS